MVLDLACLSDGPLLVASRIVALEHRHRAVTQVSHGVQAEASLSQGARRLRLRDFEFWVDVLKEPLEGLALELRSQFHSFLDAVEGR